MLICDAGAFLVLHRGAARSAPPRRFRRFSDHEPWRFRGRMGDGRNVIADAEGRGIERFSTGPVPVRSTSRPEITHRTAQMNHYVIRSGEHFAMKRGTLSATALKHRYTDRFYRARNRNGCREASALAHAARFDPIHGEAMALPGVARLHRPCCADHVARLCAARNERPEDDARWRHHRGLAGA